MTIKVIDNFLSKNELETLQNLIIFNLDFPFFLSSHLNNMDTDSTNFWEWYGSNSIYKVGDGEDLYMSNINLYNMIWGIFAPRIKYDKLIRIKANFYPHTETVKEHAPHRDYDFEHAGAVYSLNTCDGYTRIENQRVDSVENRMMFFNASKLHNSTTTSNAKGRFNINFNFL